MTTNALQAIKNESNKSLPLLYLKAIDIIEVHAIRKGNIKNRIIPYPQVYHTLSTMFHLSKYDSRTVLYELECAGLLKNVPYHGIRILRKNV